MRGRIFVLVLALVAVAISYRAREDPGTEQAVKAGPGDMRLQFVYSPEKATLMRSLVDRFNARRTVVDGRPLFVIGRSMSSGEAEQDIAHGRLRPRPGRRRRRSGVGRSTSTPTRAGHRARARR